MNDLNQPDAHVYAYRWHLPQKQQWTACDKVWQAYEAGKMTLDQALEASHRTHVKMAQAYAKIGYGY